MPDVTRGKGKGKGGREKPYCVCPTLMLCVTLDGSFFFMMLCSDTRAMGRFLDVVWYDLSVTKA